MNDNLIYRLEIGEIVCTVLADGAASFGMDGLANRFPSVPVEEMRQALIDCGVDPETVGTSYNTLLIQTAGRNILVDGGERNDRHATAGRTRECLAAAGVTPEQIDTVFITHAHGDHIAGLYEADNETLAYPAATYLIHPAEWEFWYNEERLAGMGPYGQLVSQWLKGIEPHLQFIDINEPILPGVYPVPIPGHTMGHTGLRIESGGKSLMHMVDLVHAMTQFAHPDWTVRFDTDATAARNTRQSKFNQLADEAQLTMFFHVPFPAVGHVVRSGDGFAWRPI